MSAEEDLRQKEIDRNYATFSEKLPELLKSHAGKFALMKNGEIVEFFDTAGDAFLTGTKLFEDGLFSVQEVTSNVVDLGYFSHVLS